MVKIVFKTQDYFLDLDLDLDLSCLKSLVSEEIKLNNNNFLLVFKDQVLSGDSKSLKSLGISANDTINVQEVGFPPFLMDPYSLEAQKHIEQQIKQQNIQKNMEDALEHNPEAFTRIVMLYVFAEINGKETKAFVDSGAQTTIMSPQFAESCGLIHLIDNRFSGVAKGVGVGKIIGRVHAANVKIGKDSDLAKNLYLQCSFTILETSKGAPDILIGLDTLRRFQACIDLKRCVLRIDNVEIPFLGENEVPDFLGTLESPGLNNSQPQNNNIPPLSSKSISKYSENDISKLISLGANRELAIKSLEVANGDMNVAASILFSLD